MFSDYSKLAIRCFVILHFFGFSATSASTPSPQESPEQTTVAFIRSFKEADYKAVAALLDPDDLDQLRNKIIQTANLVARKSNYQRRCADTSACLATTAATRV